MNIDNLHQKMLRIRMVEKEIAKRYKEQKMRTPVHLSIGQEACAVGVCEALGSHDVVVSSHRSHAHYLAKGGDLNAFIAELHGKAAGCSGGFGGSMHLVDRPVGFMGSTSIVAGTIPIGVGLAFAKKLRGELGTVIIFHGDAAVEEGVWHESVNFAALHDLKVIFVCENNGFSCYTPLKDRQPRENFSMLSRAHKLHYKSSYSKVNNIYLDMKDLLYMGKYPALLEVHCARWYEHCGVKEEMAGKDEISHLDGSHYLPEIEAAFKFADDSAWPENMSMYAY